VNVLRSVPDLAADDADDAVVAALPVLGVEPGHVAEAKRALAEQGKSDVDDDAVVRLLWAARALPAALDVLDVMPDGSSRRFAEAAVEVELGAVVVGGGPLVAIARTSAEARIIVDIVEQKALFAAGDDDPPAPAVCTVSIALETNEQGAGSGEQRPDIAVRRFTLGPP
jgi:hypothetical protein